MTVETIRELKALEEQIKALQHKADTIKDEIKAEMDERDLDEMVVGSYVVRYKTISNSRFDSTAFKKYNIDLYKAFLKQVASKNKIRIGGSLSANKS